MKSRHSIVVAPFALEALRQHHERQLEERAKAGDAWQDHDYVFCLDIHPPCYPPPIGHPSAIRD